jgi:trigger factor
MRTSVEPLEGNKVKLSIAVEEKEFDRALDAAYRKLAREVRIPGFRPGKAPRRLLEARMGSGAAREEALRDALPDFYARAVEESEVDAIAPPEIDITEGREDGPVAFDAVVEVRPHVQVPGYQSLKVVVPSPLASDEDVDRQVDRLRGNFGELRTVSRPARDGDHVSIDLKGYRHREPVEGLTAGDLLYEVGSGSIVAELDDQLRDARPGDILKFTAALPGEEDDAGVQVLVKEVKEKVLPDITDEWAQEASEFETFEQLRADIANRLVMVKRVQTQLALREQAVDALAELVVEEPPGTLVASEMESRLHDLVHRLEAQGATVEQYLQATGRTEDDLVSGLREAAIRAVRADLALRAVAEAEGLDATPEDVDAEMARLAERVGQKPAAVRRRLESGGQMPAVLSDLRKGEALQWLLERVEIVDEEGRPVDRLDLVLPEEPDAGTEGPTVQGEESSEVVTG